MKAFILKLHRKALPWPEGLNLGDGWFRWHLCPVDVKKETSDDREGVTVEELVAAICEITGAPPGRLKESVRRRVGNPERRFAVWALQTSTTMTHREVGEVLGMTHHHVAREARRNKAGISRFKEWTTEWLERYFPRMKVTGVSPAKDRRGIKVSRDMAAIEYRSPIDGEPKPMPCPTNPEHSISYRERHVVVVNVNPAIPNFLHNAGRVPRGTERNRVAPSGDLRR